MTLGEPASSRSGGSVQATSSRSTRSTAPPPARNGSPSVNTARGPISTPAPKGAYILWPLQATKSAAAGQGPVGGELGGVDQHGHVPLVGGGDDVVDRGQPAGDVRRGGDREQPGPWPGVEGGGDVVDGEGAVGAALDVPAPAEPGPGQQVGVVLDHGGDHDVVGRETEPVGEVVDGLGGVAADDGDVVAVGWSAGEAQGRRPGRLVGGGRPLRLVPGPPMDARVPGQELVHRLRDRREGAGRRRRVQAQVRTVVAVDARHRAGRRRPGDGALHRFVGQGSWCWAPVPWSGEVDVAVAGLPEEVLLEGELHEVALGAGDEHAVLAGREHLVGQDQHAVVAGVHDAHRGDVAEGLVGLGWFALDLGDDVLRGDVGLLLGGQPGLGDADGMGGLPGDLDGRGDADGVDVVVGLGLVGVADLDVALGIRDVGGPAR